MQVTSFLCKSSRVTVDGISRDGMIDCVILLFSLLESLFTRNGRKWWNDPQL